MLTEEPMSTKDSGGLQTPATTGRTDAAVKAVQTAARGGELTADTLPTREHLVLTPVSGAVLVYVDDPEEIGKRLIGFDDVTDRDALADALRARGHGNGDYLHLPEIDVDEREVSYR